MGDHLFRIMYGAGCALRRSPVLRHLERLDESQWWGVDRLVEHQLDSLRGLLTHARDNSPFYRAYFDENSFDPEVGSLEDLGKLPSLGKDQMARNAGDIQNDGRKGRLLFSETSGTSGAPLSFYRTSGWDAGHRAAIARGYGWYGVAPWMRNGYMWGIPSSAWERLKVRIGDRLQNRFRTKRFDLSDDTMEAFYRKLRGARFVEGYSSMLYELARFINRRHEGARDLSMLLVKGTSEKIYSHYHDEAVSAFGRRITGEYGAAESGIIAFECPQGSMHVNMEHVVVEVENGEIIVTNLLSHSFPFIRYRLGDYVRLRDSEYACPCGRQGQVIEEITGRVGRRILGRGGESFPSLTVYYVLKGLVKSGAGVVRGQARQRARGELEFTFVLESGRSPDAGARFESVFEDTVRRIYGDPLTCRFELVDEIPRTGVKAVDFVSEIDTES